MQIVALRHICEYYPPVMSFFFSPRCVCLLICFFLTLSLSLSLYSFLFYLCFLLFAAASRPRLGSTQPPIHVTERMCGIIPPFPYAFVISWFFIGRTLRFTSFFIYLFLIFVIQGTPVSVVGVLNRLRAGLCGDRIPVGAREFSLFQNV